MKFFSGAINQLFNYLKEEVKHNLDYDRFLRKLGKSRIRMLVKDNVEIPSDLSGILYEKHDSGGAWRMKLCCSIIY